MVSAAAASKLRRMHKLVYKNGLRKQFESCSLLYEKKTTLSSQNFQVLCTCDNDVVVVAPIQYKMSHERKIPPNSFDDDILPASKIIRYYLYDENGIRVAIEQKFHTMANVSANSRHLAEKEYYDIFNYEMSLVTLHLEYEFDAQQLPMEQAIQILKTCIQTNALVNELLCIIMFGNSNYLDGISKSKCDKLLLRPFVYNLPADTTMPLKYVSVKLDGKRAKFEIINDILYIHEWSESIKLNKKFIQHIVGHIEKVGLTYFIIDIFSISSSIHSTPIDHCTACSILNQLSGSLTKNVNIQKFYTSIQEYIECDTKLLLPNDGFLLFYSDAIVKKKSIDNKKIITVDLMITKTIYLNNLIAYLQDLYAQKIHTIVDANGYETSLTYNNCKPGKHNVDVDLILNQPILQSLQFSNDEFFSTANPQVQWNLDMAGCNNLWGDEHFGIINICILELRVDYATKTLHFQRFRHDKYTANSIKTFLDMCM